MGLFSTVYLISSMTVMQLNVPEQLRGRVMGLHGITYSLIPLGGLLAGFLAEVWSAPVAIGTNATLLLLAVICAAGAGPTLRQLDGAAMSER
jgi:MFS family permease